jgi:histidine ammonia-lyase
MIQLTGESLTLEEVERVVFGEERVVLDGTAKMNIAQNRHTLERLLTEEETMYGINTGFGKLSHITIEEEKLADLQINLLRSHACGVGENFSEKVSRAMLLLRANALARGYSGIRPILLERMISYLNEGIHPVIPSQGSLGASGDLAPLAHLALTLIGEGEVFYEGKRVETGDVLKRVKKAPLTLKAKEGLALINGTQAMTAIGAIIAIEMERLLYQSEIIAAMTMEGLQGIHDAFASSLHEIRHHPAQIEVAERMRKNLAGSKLTTSQGELRVQDAYSVRCIPQVLGASWDTLCYAKEKVQLEMNAVTDNPLIFTEEKRILSGGNFHGQPIAFAMDFLKLGIAELANIAERRVERLVNPQLNGDLPAFLSPRPGLESGAMILQYTAASLVSENKTLAHPASVDSIPSSANQEDHVSMGTIAARHAYAMLENTRRVVAIELICALQACDIRGKENMAHVTRTFYEKAREVVPSITEDRVFSGDIKQASDWLKHAPESNPWESEEIK